MLSRSLACYSHGKYGCVASRMRSFLEADPDIEMLKVAVRGYLHDPIRFEIALQVISIIFI